MGKERRDSVSRWNEFAKDAGVKPTHASQINDNLLLLEPER